LQTGRRAEIHVRRLLLSRPISMAEAPFAFETTAREVSRAVLDYLIRYVGDSTVAEDLLQETLIRMNKGLAGFESRASIKTWAFSIASRVAADYLRHPQRQTHVVAPAIGVPPGGEERIERLLARATEVLGDDDSQPVWWHRNDTVLGRDEIGQSLTPVQLASQSEEGLQRLLVLLDELAQTVSPRWKPKLGRRRSRR